MKILRIVLFIPAIIIEIILATTAGLLATIHYVCSVILDIAYKLPDIGWYVGGEYKRKQKPNGFPKGRRE